MGFAAVCEEEFEAIKLRVIEMPEFGIGQSCGSCQRVCGARRNRKDTGVAISEDFETSVLFDDAKRSVTMPGFRTVVSAMSHDRKLGLRVAGIRKSVHVELFDKHFGGDEELHRSENAAVVREVAGASPREHVKVEGIVHAHDERIRRSRVDQMR